IQLICNALVLDFQVYVSIQDIFTFYTRDARRCAVRWYST
ncbi:12863_t:CDS:2, partial [Funneliformis mosseae]